jgi:ATP-binding protein involved in chromosome partitioning
MFGAPDGFRATANKVGLEILAELPLVPGVSTGGDAGMPYALASQDRRKDDGVGGVQWIEKMQDAARRVWKTIDDEVIY